MVPGRVKGVKFGRHSRPTVLTPTPIESNINLRETLQHPMLSPQGHRITRLFPGIHYAWIIIVIASIMHMAGGSVRQAFGVLVVPLQQLSLIHI